MDQEEKKPFIQVVDEATIEDGRVIAILAYITVVGFIIAIVLNNDKKNPFAFFHIRQSLGIWLLGLVIGVVAVIPFLGWIVALVGWVLIVVLWVIGLINAIGGKMKPVPIFGNLFEDLFKSIR